MDQYSASFAFRLACDAAGSVAAGFTRAKRAKHLDFVPFFLQMKEKVRDMDMRFVEESDSNRQALLEMYVAIELRTPYNDFGVH